MSPPIQDRLHTVCGLHTQLRRATWFRVKKWYFFQMEWPGFELGTSSIRRGRLHHTTPQSFEKSLKLETRGLALCNILWLDKFKQIKASKQKVSCSSSTVHCSVQQPYHKRWSKCTNSIGDFWSKDNLHTHFEGRGSIFHHIVRAPKFAIEP